jgi:2-phosphosulfolactate phosphatase
MTIDVVFLPQYLTAPLAGRACAVFDVLRATTTMTAALAAGVKEIRLFADLLSARSSAQSDPAPHLLCGEEACLRPQGFDLGNSPGQFLPAHRGATLYMCTTNGTRALLAARDAHIVIPAALVNASAVARVLRETNRDVVLLCAGTNGQIAMEDCLGAGAVIDALTKPATPGQSASAVPGSSTGFSLSDSAQMSLRLFDSCRHGLRSALSETAGGRNVLSANLPQDIDFASRLNAFDVVGIASGDPLTVRPLT